ncbi:hypothetical protein, partial [Halomonas sp. OfavH-34-E]|uniref:hypothetical protein n=1 Tax=Halomonas sp. OfavH-34-E TaxID=2954491 RepID=UPI002096D7C5
MSDDNPIKRWTAKRKAAVVMDEVTPSNVNVSEVCPDFINSDCPVFISALSSELRQGRVGARPPSWRGVS